ncbi:hypothetical protein BCT47_25595 [Vibrio splendidus]|uniref:Uncharacterized protein n=4 Tax=Vibrio TaxID=662 RepID=A0A0H3ZQC8_9VIBR|nr:MULTISPECIES: hypothetical protein [Vibrio]AKN35861.1 hypothetical protein [Vibrio tasmaniensis]MCC4790272.1 hypothetical protein [Vibrio splendidus]MDH5933632.1 hypothetical protein [Vibrio splendidus]MDP2503851.1 hypothetical protein [Vibrio splendidus]MDP2592870.1 hypothetical protein [Vibrio splendidus]
MSKWPISFLFEKNQSRLEVAVIDLDVKQRISDFYQLAQKRYLLEEFLLLLNRSQYNVFQNDVLSCLYRLGIKRVDLKVGSKTLNIL